MGILLLGEVFINSLQQDLSELDEANHLSQNAPGATVDLEKIVEADMAVQIVPTVTKVVPALTVHQVK